MISPELINKLQDRIPVIVGPTAVGKTTFTIGLAKELDGEIISVDSRQIYRGFTIGTAQPVPEELGSVRCHLINLLSPHQVITAGDYAELTAEKINEIQGRDKVPILSGGTLLYVNAICSGIIEDSQDLVGIREIVQKRISSEGSRVLYRELEAQDPKYASLFHHNDLKRLARAHEILIQSGKTPSEVFREQRQRDKAVRERYFIIKLERDREELYQRIEKRVDEMIRNGWLNEVQFLLSGDVKPEDHAMQGVGYSQIARVLKGELKLDEAAVIIKQKTRQFAKRQLTWLRKMDIDLTVSLSGDSIV